jgi:predicted membrane-bound spermidine synthase
MILFLFFCSGATALIYEVVWSKYLALMLGSTIYAQTVVLAVFMGGLALGNRLIGARSDLLARPLAGYGCLEVAIGLYAFCYNWIYHWGDQMFVALGSRLLEHSVALLLLKGMLSVGLLILPTLLMGGTLPLLAAWLQRQSDDAGRWSARFYSINSLGAVCGACAAGFYLLPTLGLESSLQMTALANVIIGFVAIGFARREVSRASAAVAPVQTAAAAPRPSGLASVTFLVALTGGVSMGLEVLASRSLSLIFGASVQAFAIVLMAFIFGIGLGSSAVASPRLRRWRNETLIFALLLSAAAVVGVLVLGIELWVEAYRHVLTGLARTPMGYRFYQFIAAGFSMVILGLPAALIGAVLPLGIRLVSQRGADLGNQVGRLLTWNTLGAVVGVLLTGFVLMPQAGLRNAFNLLALALCVPVLVWAWTLKRKAFVTAGSLLVVGLVVSCVAAGEGWRYVLSSGVFRSRETRVDPGSVQARKKHVKILFYEDAADATVSVEEWDATTNSVGISLRINGKPEASSKGDLGTQMMLGHLPMMLRPESKDVFILGLASGISASAFLAHPVEHIVVADNCAPVLRAVHLFAPWNRGVATNPVTRIWLEDARTVLKLNPQKYDVIVSEPSNPWFASIGSVFSREFYQIAANRLKPGGLMVQWFHVYEMHDGIVDLVLRTFGSVFPSMEIWDSGAGDVILVGSNQQWDSSPEHLRIAYARELVRKDLAAIGIDSPEAFLARQFASQRTAFAIPGPGPVQSDGFPILEYEAPLAFFIGATASSIARFDERTWQSSFASPEKRSVLSQLSDRSLQAVFEYSSINQELRQAISTRLPGAHSVSGVDPLVPCIFRPARDAADLQFPPSASDGLKELLRAQLGLQRDDPNWTEHVQTIRNTLPAVRAGKGPELHRAALRSVAAAIRASLVHRDFKGAKELLALGEEWGAEDAELGYLGRLCERATGQGGP